MDNKLSYSTFLKQEETIYAWLCIGIVYSLVFWTALNSILSIILFLYWLFFSKKIFNLSSLKTRLMILFGSVYLVCIIGMIYTSNLPEGLFRLQQKSALLVFPLIFGSTTISAKALKNLKFHFAIAICISCLIGLGVGLVRYAATKDAEVLNKEHLIIFPDMNPPITGLFCLLGIIFLLNYLFRDKKRNILLVAAIAFLAFFIMLLSVRLIILCLLLILVVYVFKYIASPLFRLGFVIFLVLATALSVFFIPTLRKQLIELMDFSDYNKIELDKDASLGKSWGGKSIRFAIWQCTMDVVNRHWLTGVGTGDVQDSLQAAYEKRKFYFASRYNRFNVHNQPLELWVANGLPGLLIYLLCLAVPLMVYARQPSSLEYILFLSIVLVMSMTETILNVNKGIVWYSFFNSIFAFVYLNPDSGSISTKTKKAV